MSPPTAKHVLLVDDDASFRVSLAALMRREGWSPTEAGSLAQARERLGEARPDLVILDLDLPDGHGLDLRLAEDVPVDTPFVVVSGSAEAESARRALRAGAEDYLVKPLDPGRLKTVLHGLEQAAGLREQVSDLRAALRRSGRFGQLVGATHAMQRVYDLIERVAPTAAPVLITGESGTGKEVVAATLHEMSKRRDEAFVAINCGAIPDTLIESRLFGHEKGAFTGADRRQPGVFEQADGGTLFLDEIGEMPPELQVRLLRVLETKLFQRVGGTATLRADVRLIAATNRDPQESIRTGRLREDLYHRLSVFPIHLPPLRERSSDIPLLVTHFAEALPKDGPGRRTLTREALGVFAAHPWPGNVRELRNAVQRAFILSPDRLDEATARSALSGVGVGVGVGAGPDRAISNGIPSEPLASVPVPPPAALGPDGGAESLRVPLPCTWSQVEQIVIEGMLRHCGGNKRKTARDLGISVKTLYARLRDYEAAAKSEARV
ncbi:MAG: sigma-54-dependent transcriptional regulator [Planctomycetota bacterium]